MLRHKVEELEKLLERLKEEERLCRVENKELKEKAERLREIAQTIRELASQGEDVLKKVFEEVELVEEI